MPIGSAFTRTQDPSLETQIGSAYTHTQDPSLEEHIGSAFTRTQDPSLETQIGSAFTHTQDDPIPSLLRGEQINSETIGVDRLSFNTVRILSTTSVDLTDAEITNLLTVPPNEITVPLGLLIEATTATNVTIDPQVSLGINGAADDIFALEIMVDFITVGDIWTNWLVLSNSRAAIDYQFIKLNVQTAATATALLAKVHLIGFLI
jgi:hypothetical protein